MVISELAMSPAAMSAAPIWGSERLPSGPSGLIMSAAAVSLQGTTVPGFSGGTAALRAVPRVRPVQVLKALVLTAQEQHGQPATKQHDNYNPVAGGYVATATAGPPHRRAPV